MKKQINQTALLTVEHMVGCLYKRPPFAMACSAAVSWIIAQLDLVYWLEFYDMQRENLVFTVLSAIPRKFREKAAID